MGLTLKRNAKPKERGPEPSRDFGSSRSLWRRSASTNADAAKANTAAHAQTCSRWAANVERRER